MAVQLPKTTIMTADDVGDAEAIVTDIACKRLVFRQDQADVGQVQFNIRAPLKTDAAFRYVEAEPVEFVAQPGQEFPAGETLAFVETVSGAGLKTFTKMHWPG